MQGDGYKISFPATEHSCKNSADGMLEVDEYGRLISTFYSPKEPRFPWAKWAEEQQEMQNDTAKFIAIVSMGRLPSQVGVLELLNIDYNFVAMQHLDLKYIESLYKKADKIRMNTDIDLDFVYFCDFLCHVINHYKKYPTDYNKGGE